MANNRVEFIRVSLRILQVCCNDVRGSDKIFVVVYGTDRRPVLKRSPFL